MKKYKVYYEQIMITPMSVIVEAEDAEDTEFLFEGGEFDDNTITEESFWVEEPILKIGKIEEIENE